jgi:FkbM family methyltransferase
MVYEPYMLACLTRLLRGSDVPRFMDVGAYLGYFAFYAVALMKDQSDVYAIESNEGSVAAMRKSIRANGFSRLHVVQAALSDRIEAANIGWLTVSAAEDPGTTTTTTTTTVTLDKLCASNKWYPNIVKIDVHGAEGKVILGMRETLKSVDALLLELHRLPLLAKYSPGVTRTKVLDVLEEAGLKLYYIAGQSSMVDGAVEPPNFEELVAGQGFGYCRLDRASRRLLLFDRSHDEFVLALRCGEADVKALLGESVTQVNE